MLYMSNSILDTGANEQLKRPFYSLLNKLNIKETFQVDIPFWRESLSEYLAIAADLND